MPCGGQVGSNLAIKTTGNTAYILINNSAHIISPVKNNGLINSIKTTLILNSESVTIIRTGTCNLTSFTSSKVQEPAETEVKLAPGIFFSSRNPDLGDWGTVTVPVWIFLVSGYKFNLQ